jgi:hypothetical protein
MRPFTTDVSIYGTFDFERPPVGIKFLFKRPEGIEQLVLGIDSDIYYHWIPIMTQNLQEMEWVLHAYTDRETYLAEWERIISTLLRDSENP